MCDSTIDHITHFYEIRDIVSNNTDFYILGVKLNIFLFLSTEPLAKDRHQPEDHLTFLNINIKKEHVDTCIYILCDFLSS
jgi:hypothetical protein